MNATSKLVKAWESKNAKNAAKAGGISMMALSLAACGGSSTTTTTATDTTTDTTTVVAPVAASLTSGVDAITGTAGNDSISGAKDANDLQTLNSADTIAGGEGTDTLTVTLSSANVTPATGGISGVENLVVTATGGARTIDFSSATADFINGVTHITNQASATAANFTDITEIAEITVNNAAAATLIEFNTDVLSGSDDTVTVNLVGASAAVTVGTNGDADGDYETLVVNVSGAASDMVAGGGMGGDAATVTVAAAVAMDFGTTAAFGTAESFNAEGSAGAVTAVFEDFDSGDTNATAITTAKTITGGAGADSFDVSAMEAADVGVLTINGGAGNDTITVGSYAENTMVIDGGDGDDTLATAAAITAANAVGIKNMETLKSSGANTTHDLSLYTINTFTKGYAAGADTEFTNAHASFDTVTLNAAASTTAKVDYLVDGTVAGGNANTTKVVMAANVVMSGSLDVAETEYLTLDSSSGSISLGDDGLASSSSGNGGLTATDLVTLTLVGDNNIDLIGETASNANYVNGTLLSTVDAAGVTGTATVQINASVSTTAMTVTGPASSGQFTFTGGSKADTITAGGGALVAVGGAGDDVITGGAKVDNLTGGDGADTLYGGALGDTLRGSAGNDSVYLGDGDAKTDTVTLEGTALGGADVIYNFSTASTGGDSIDMATNSANNGLAGASAAALTTYEEFATAAAWATANDANAVLVDENETGMAVIAANLSDAGSNGIDTTDLINLMGTAGIFEQGSGTATLTQAAYIAADDGTDTYIFLAVNSGGTSADSVLTSADAITLLGTIDGLADATDLSAGNFADFA